MSADGRQFILPLADELIVDLFAGGGGMSTAIEQAMGRHADIAANHDDDATSMHRANHPQTRHFIAGVFEVDPRGATRGRPVGLVHLSPDCTHFSQAKGGQARDTKIRGLSWVGKRWAGQVRPRVITLENVKQIRDWGPLIAKRDPATGRVVKLDGTVAAPGERVPVQQQFLVPDPRHKGRTWARFLRDLRALGYVVEHRLLCAADYGAPTTRERLFLVARCDGEAIRWPEMTHHKAPKRGQKRWRAAAECIDWSLPCPSIFDRPRPLADATLRRIARGLQRYVIDAADPFIVPVTHACDSRVHGVDEPLRTITTAQHGEFMLCAPTLIQTGYGEREGQEPRAMDIGLPLGTVVAGGVKHAAVAAFLAQHNTMPGGSVHAGHDAREPLSAITKTGSQQGIVTARLGQLSPEHEAGALRVAAFLMRYYGEGGQWGDLRDPAPTITTKDRLALVTVMIKGTPSVIVDIGQRMFVPRELYRAQGFPDSYIIERGHDGRKFSKSAQVRMVGNSVSPPPAAALIRANFSLSARRVAA